MWRAYLSIPFFLGGLFFLTVATVGLIRLPDTYTRMHATGKGDTLGFGLVLTGLIIVAPSVVVALKYVLLIGLIWVINPTTSHVLANAAYRYGGQEMPGTNTLDLRVAEGEGGPRLAKSEPDAQAAALPERQATGQGGGQR